MVTPSPAPTPLLDELPLGYYMTPDRRVLARAPLGLTAYLDGQDAWAHGGAQKMLRRFLSRVPRAPLTGLATSLMSHWKPLTDDVLADALESFETRGLLHGMRHLFWLKIANDAGAPGLGFSYWEIDPRRANRAGILEITLYEVEDPRLLHELALALLDCGPVYSLVGGFAFRWDEHEKAVAFEQIYRWASRHVGIDCQMREDMSWLAPKVVPGVSWLTYVGGGLARNAEIDLAALRAQPFEHRVHAQPVADGVLFMAGDRPLMGDLNRFRWPFEYAEVARRLAPWFPEVSPDLFGPFFREHHTSLWFRRLVDPSGWVDRDPQGAY